VRFRWWWIPLAVAAIAIVAIIPRAFSNPSTISQVSIVNNTSYALDVQVAGASKDGWTGLTTAERNKTTVVQDVVDQGKTWIFRLQSQGIDGGELTFSKADLEHSGWKVVIPDSVATRLASEGATPTPPPGF
jgi:hypothetical protein